MLILLMVFSENPDIFDIYDQDNAMANVNVLAEAMESPLFGNMEPELIYALENGNASWLSHDWGLSPEMYEKTPGLKENFDMLALANDSCNKEFVAALEAKHFPIYLTQFHPERNGYEWFDSESIPHSPEAILIGQYMGNFLVDEARKNSHKFDSIKQLNSMLIDDNPITIMPENQIPIYFFKTSA